MENRFITRSIDRVPETFDGQATRPCNRTDIHLIKISCKIAGEEAREAYSCTSICQMLTGVRSLVHAHGYSVKWSPC